MTDRRKELEEVVCQAIGRWSGDSLAIRNQMARAAIAAIYEACEVPTTEMVEAGNKQFFARKIWMDDEAGLMWQAMFPKALGRDE